ncbi:MAG: 3'-5' exonuclease [Anaerolineales bacterium]|jgi:DNA polymerase-3 subunit epsilon
MSASRDRQQARLTAQHILSQKPVFLDTETTGIGPGDELVEICVLDHQGEILVESLVKPLGKVDPGALRHHGITDSMLVGAPPWPEVWPLVKAAIDDRWVAVYNADFDVRMMRQSHAKHGMRWEVDESRFHCIMTLYAQFYGDWNRRRSSYRWQKLEEAARQCGIMLRNTHRAQDDALLTRAVLHHMGGKLPDQGEG